MCRTRLERAGPRDGALGHQCTQSKRPAGSEGQTSASISEQTEGEPRRGLKLLSGQPGTADSDRLFGLQQQIKQNPMLFEHIIGLNGQPPETRCKV